MYELFTKDDWEFSVDIDTTKEYYRTYSGLCNCDGCKNFCQAIRGYSAELTEFLEQFGIDIEKPIEAMWFVVDKQSKTVDYTAYYAVHGTAAKGSYEIDFGTINVVVQNPKNSPNTEIPKPYFVFQIFNLFLPWVLTDNIDSLDSTKEKRSRKKRQKLDVARNRNIFGKTSDMVPADCENYDHIETLVLSKLAFILDVSMLKKDEQHRYYIIDSVNDMGLQFCGNEVIIMYSKEHHHIMGMDYETMDEWAAEILHYIELLINRTVRFEFCFHGKKQIRVKVYTMLNGKEELIEHIRTTLNPFLLISKASRIETVLIEFKQQ